MTEASKLTLSDEELQLAGNTNWILTKRIIIDKVVAMFAQLAATMQGKLHLQKALLPSIITQSTPKIAKGENYLQLPWVMLDYPRYFSGADALAVRCMFWWGNGISITLHVSGTCKTMLQQRFADILISETFCNYYLCVNEDEWQHHFKADNYLPVKELPAEKILQIIDNSPFIKIAVRFELQQWSEMPELLEKEFLQLLDCIKN
jgi:hypothetical protein